MRIRQSLDGFWDYRIGRGAFIKKWVPYSEHPVGESECVLLFDADAELAGHRAFLVFEGITYSADVMLNGHFLGTMLPYSEYRFEVGKILKQRQNRLCVWISDLEVAFGSPEGWKITAASFGRYIWNTRFLHCGGCILAHAV